MPNDLPPIVSAGRADIESVLESSEETAWLAARLSKAQGRSDVHTTIVKKGIVSTPPSVLVKLDVTCRSDAGKSVAQQVLLKIPKEHKRVIGRREIDFYTNIAPHLNGIDCLVRCLNSGTWIDSDYAFLVLEDLTSTHRALNSPTVTTQDLHAIVTALASIHAKAWASANIRDAVAAAIGMEPAEAISDQFNGNERRLTELLNVVDGGQHRLVDAAFTLFNAKATAVLCERINHGRALTLCHPDSHGGNFLIERRAKVPNVRVIDWHSYRWSFGPQDVATLLIESTSPRRRRMIEDTVVQAYHRQLVSCGVLGYAWEECWHDYRLGAIAYMDRALGARNMPWLHQTLSKALAAWNDLQCASLLCEP